MITGVTEDERELPWRVMEHPTLEILREKLGETLTMTIRGKQLRLAAKGALQGVAPADLAVALSRLQCPCTIILEVDGEPNCGEDHISG